MAAGLQEGKFDRRRPALGPGGPDFDVRLPADNGASQPAIFHGGHPWKAARVFPCSVNQILLRGHQLSVSVR